MQPLPQNPDVILAGDDEPAFFSGRSQQEWKRIAYLALLSRTMDNME